MGKLLIVLFFGFIGLKLSATTIDYKKINDGFPVIKHQSLSENKVQKEAAWSNTSPEVDVKNYSLQMIAYKDKNILSMKENIELVIDADMQELLLDAGSFLEVQSVSVNERSHLFAHIDSTLKIFLNEGATKGQILNIGIVYQVNMKNNPAFANAEKDGLPIQIATFTEPLNPRNWLISNDSPHDKATYEILAYIPKAWQLMSNGSLIDSSEAGDEYNSYSYKMRDPIATYLISIVIGNFKTYQDQWQNVPLSYWYDEVAGEKGLEVLKETPQMFDYFARKLIPYPFEKYNVTSAINSSGAMEHTTNTTFSSSALASSSGRTIALHELAHHWFGDTVTCADWHHIWLNESFATFFEIDYVRDVDGYDAYMNSLDETKTSYLIAEPTNGELGPIVNYQTGPEEKFFSSYGRITYSKGGIVLNYLRVILGDEAFFKGLKSYLTDSKLYMGVAYTSQLKKHLEKSSGMSLDRFFKQYILEAGRPEIVIKEISANKYSITQKSAEKVGLFDLYIPLVKYSKGGEKSSDKFIVQGEEEYFELKMESSLIAVAFDPNLEIPGTIELDYKPETAKWLLSNSKLHNKYLKAILADLGRKNALNFSEWTTTYKATDDIGLRSQLFSYAGEKFSDKNELVDLMMPYLLSENSSDLRGLIAVTLAKFKFSQEQISKYSKPLIEIFENDENIYNVVIPLSEALAKNKIDFGALLEEKIKLSVNEGSLYYGSLIRAAIWLNGRESADKYVSDFQKLAGNFRGRLAWALSLLKEDIYTEAIASALQVEYSKPDFSQNGSFAVEKMSVALVTIHTDLAKKKLEVFVADSNYSEKFKEKARAALVAW